MEVLNFKILTDGKYSVKWQEHVEDNDVRSQFESMEEPNPELIEALDQLSDYVIEVAELNYEANITVVGITVKYVTEARATGFVVTANKALSCGCALRLVTPPHYLEKMEGYNTVPKNYENMFKTFLNETEKYIKGERMQINLLADGKDEVRKQAVSDIG